MTDPGSSPDPKASAHWSRFWARGCLTSLPQDFSGNYDGEVAEFWRARWVELPEGARVLDVCTGSGAVALLAAAYGRDSGHRLEISGLDAARVDPDHIRGQHPGWAALVDRIRFIDQTRFEDFDGAPGSWDAIVSQYGIEYCDWPGAARQVRHLLAPGGRLSVLAHTVSTDMIRTMRAEHEQYALLDRLELVKGCRAVLAGRLSTGRFRKLLRSVSQPLEREFRRTGAPLYEYALGLVRQAPAIDGDWMDRQRAALESFHLELADGRARLADLLGVNEAIEADPDWHRVFERSGLEFVDSGRIEYRGRHHVGDFFRYRNPG